MEVSTNTLSKLQYSWEKKANKQALCGYDKTASLLHLPGRNCQLMLTKPNELWPTESIKINLEIHAAL